jgi:putative ABC transport system ATP-binding protein
LLVTDHARAGEEEGQTTSPAGVSIAMRAVGRHYSSRGSATVTALDGVALEIAAGEAVALVGPSGSGKSTLLHVMGGMDRPDRGEVHVGGRRIDQLTTHDLALFRRTVGFVFQRFHLMPALTVADNVLAPLLPRRVDFDRRERARELLDAVGMAGRADALPSELSGGQQQRVAIARALIASPSLLLADEPTGSLDTATGQAVMELMLRLVRSAGRTLVLATHNMDVAAMCQRTVYVRDGQVHSAT